MKEKRELNNKQAGIVFIFFGVLFLCVGSFVAYVTPEKLHVPYWVVVLAALIFIYAGLGWFISKERELVRALIFRRVVPLCIIGMLYGIGFHGTGSCAVSSGGATLLEGRSFMCTFPGYIAIVWFIFYVLTGIQGLHKFLKRKQT